MVYGQMTVQEMAGWGGHAPSQKTPASHAIAAGKYRRSTVRMIGALELELELALARSARVTCTRALRMRASNTCTAISDTLKYL